MMIARVITTSNGGASARFKVSRTLVPGSPRMEWTASISLMSRTGLPSTWVIRSPVLRPARSAGVSSIGEITLINPSSWVTWMPRPPKRPDAANSVSCQFLGVEIDGMGIQ